MGPLSNKRRRKDAPTFPVPRQSAVTDLDGERKAGRQSSIKSFFSRSGGTGRRQQSVSSFVARTPGNQSSQSVGPSRSAAQVQVVATPPTPLSPALLSARVRTPPTSPLAQEVRLASTPPSPREDKEGTSPLKLISNTRQHNNSKSTRSTEKHKTKKKAKGFQQLYLDLGQRHFAKPTVCSTCGMLYVHGVEEDIRQHKRICEVYQLGVPFQTNPIDANCRVVASIDKNTYIVEVRPTDSYALRKKVAQVRAIVDRELGFSTRITATSKDLPRGDATDGSPMPLSTKDDPLTTYLYVLNKRVVGMMSAERITQAHVLQRHQGGASSLERSIQTRTAAIGIYQMWVHSFFRRQGIATRLMDAIREKLIYGFVSPVDQVAFSSPTEAGADFAYQYVLAGTRSGTEDAGQEVLVYDCL